MSRQLISDDGVTERPRWIFELMFCDQTQLYSSLFLSLLGLSVTTPTWFHTNCDHALSPPLKTVIWFNKKVALSKTVTTPSCIPGNCNYNLLSCAKPVSMSCHFIGTCDHTIYLSWNLWPCRYISLFYTVEPFFKFQTFPWFIYFFCIFSFCIKRADEKPYILTLPTNLQALLRRNCNPTHFCRNCFFLIKKFAIATLITGLYLSLYCIRVCICNI